MENPSTSSNVATALPPPARLHKLSMRMWVRALLTLAFGFSALIGVWFLGVCPLLHRQAVVLLDTAWSGAETLGSMYLVNLPDGQQNLLFSERFLSNTLNTSSSDDHAIQNWLVTVTPANIRLSFTTCGQNCTVTAILSVHNNNEIQVKQVQVQGIFALIMSDDEAMENLKDHLQFFDLLSNVTKITLLEHAISIQIS